MKCFALILSLVCWIPAHPQTLDPLVDYRLGTEVLRDAKGNTLRSDKVPAAFRKLWACPVTGAHIGSCPGWAIDHVIPLACGGKDAVWNMQWLPDQIKSDRGEFSKDHFERRIYGGNNLSKGCP
jgi:5-methylcytosine-specific restriction endonuclease McrA